MALQNITYDDKVAVNPVENPINQVLDADMNELKGKINQNNSEQTGVNAQVTTNQNNVTNNSNNIATNTADIATNRTDIDQNTNDIDGVKQPFASIQMQEVTAPAYNPGLSWFDGANWNFYDNINDTSVQLGKELVVDVRNDNGGALENFTVVRYDSAIGGVPSVVRAQADTIANCQSVAVMTHHLEVGEIGKACFTGIAGGDTSAWGVDDRLFVSADTPGLLTNVEQPILSYVGIVLISDAINGLILVNPTGIRNIVAIGQSSGQNRTGTLTTTPSSITAYENNAFEVNVDITHGGATNFTTVMSPASIGASGYFRINFNVAMQSTANALYYFEVYINGAGTGVVGLVDCRNNNVDAGGVSFNAISQTPISETDTVEIYGYADGGTNAVTYTSCLMNIERIGNY